MKGLILAAGRGSRLEELTADRPKGLVELRGRSLVAHQLGALRAAGVDDIALVRGYRGERFGFDVRYVENERWSETGIAHSLACARDWLAGGTTIVSYADIVYEPRAVQALVESDADLSIAYDVHWRELWEQRFEDPLSDAETFRVDEAGWLLEIGSRAASLDEIQGQYMGLLRFTPNGSRQLLEIYDDLEPERRDRIDMTALLALALARGVRVRAVPFDGVWCEVDDASDLAVAEQVLRGVELP